MKREVEYYVRGNENSIQDVVTGTEKDHWGTYNSPIHSYESTFNYPISSFVKERSSIKGNFAALNVMGQTPMLSELSDMGLSLGVAITLNDWRSKRQKLEDSRKNLHQVEGDILLGSTWRQADTTADAHGNTRQYDLITCRPVAGLAMLPMNPNISFLLLNKMYERLSSDGGLLLLQYATRSMIYETVAPIVDWARYMHEDHDTEVRLSPGFESEHGLELLSIIKKPNSPETLPKLPNYSPVNKLEDLARKAGVIK